MKKLLLLLSLLPLLATAQVAQPDSVSQGGTSFTPQFNYIGPNARTMKIQVRNPTANKYFGLYTAYQSDQRFAPYNSIGYLLRDGSNALDMNIGAHTFTTTSSIFSLDITNTGNIKANTSDIAGGGVSIGGSTNSPNYLAIRAASLQFFNASASNYLNLLAPNVTGAVAVTLPVTTGTLALTGDISAAVNGTINNMSKFTGANSVGNSSWFDNGTYSLTANPVNIGTFVNALSTLDINSPITLAMPKGISSRGEIQASNTNVSYGFFSEINTNASATTSQVIGYQVRLGSLNGASIPIMTGYEAFSNFVGGTTRTVGFRGMIPVGATNYNLYMNGAAQNHLLGLTGFGVLVPTSRVDIAAGSTTVTPMRFASGALNTTALVGGEEFLTDKRYFTITTGAARKEYTLNDVALNSGVVPFTTTNGRLTNPTGTTAQYITGAGTLVTFPTIPTAADYYTTNTNQTTGLTGNKTTSGNWTFTSTMATKQISATGGSFSPDAMGIIGVTQLSGGNYASYGITRNGNFAMGIGIATNNRVITGTGPSRGSTATIDTIITSHDYHTGDYASYNYLGTKLFGYNSAGIGTFSGGLDLTAGGIRIYSTGAPSGPLLWNNNTSGFFTSLIPVDPTANRSILIPDVSGTLALTGQTDNVLSKTANYTIVGADFVSGKKTTLDLYVDAAAGNVTITMPSATTFAGYTIYVTKTDATANTVTINTVLGGNSITAQYQAKQFNSNSTAWYNH